MKNNKGFTLVELLAIIVIMGVIVAIAVPNMNKQIAKGEENTQTILDEKIENAAKMYAAKYYADRLISDNAKITFTLKQLQEDGLINLKSNQCANKREKFNIKISITNDKVIYDYTDIKDSDCYSK